MTKDLSEGLVLDLDMETLQDYSGNSNDGTATGTTLTTDKDGNYNKARSFNGSSDYIQLPGTWTYTSTDDRTYRIWFKSINNSGQQNLFSHGNYASTFTTFLISINPSGQIIVYSDSSANFNGANGVLSTTSGLQDSTWHCLHIVQDGVTSNTVKMYIDGVLDKTASITGDGTASSNELEIGREISGTPYRYFYGSLFGPKFWNRALSAEGVYQDYTDIKHNFQGLFDGLVAGYDFKGDAKDFSGNGNDVTENSITYVADEFNCEDGSASFNGSSSYGVIPNGAFSGSGNFTIISKVKLDGDSLYTFLDEDGTGTGERVIFQFNSNYLGSNDAGKISVFLNDGSTNKRLGTASDTLINDGDYHVVAFVRDTSDSQGLIIYFDGSPVTLTSGVMPTGDVQGSNGLKLGVERNLGGTYFDGNLSYLGFYNSALSNDNIIVITDLLNNGKLYPYPQHRIGGITE